MATNPSQPGTPPPSHETVVTQAAVVIPLDPSLQQQAEACLKRSGKITIRFKEVQVTQLPSTIASVVEVVD